uniref:Alkylated DNA repair dioxygenase n=1 Tax=Pithovirus LCPAC201 TaxID=2506591 RepID=A0A481Z4B4_9VIRU|nr:MAG: alkylated DNA repair dioxygenase [Pithovirus LCPAC201]
MTEISPEIFLLTGKSQAKLWKKVFQDLANNLLKEVNFQQEVVIMMGKRHTLRRLTSYQGDEGMSYRYSGKTRPANPWTPCLLAIKTEVERITGQKYNFAVINYYPDGRSKLGWHSDDERDLVSESIIASVSFGAKRDFQVRIKPLEKGGKPGPIINIPLESGDLLTMEGDFQKELKHSVPARARVKDYRINITFRLISR